MLDFLHLPPRVGRTDIQIFKGTGSWQTWRKPRGVSMVYILCIGGAGAGGRGEDDSGGGGGGGGSGGHSRCLIQAGLLSDTLFAKPGLGGPGRKAGGAGIDGEISYVSVSQSIVANNVIARSGAVEAQGGGAGAANVGGGGGAGETIVLIATMPLGALGHYAMIAGRVGSNGGPFSGPGIDITLPTTSCITTGGCGGGGPDHRGGAFTAVANTLISERLPASPASPGTTGQGGSGSPPFYAPLYSLGGQGGSGSPLTDGGDGGNGINGSGGGGSGSGGAVLLGGRGGDGGNGLVIIASW